MTRHLVWGVLLLLIFAGCGKKSPRVVSPPSDLRKGWTQRGLATWYGHGDGYHGKRTANGEKMDKNKLTAAHYSLPFGTVVKVRNLKNNKEVKVRINDRYPIETLRKGRIIDVSYKAAQTLEMIRDGVVNVVLEIVSLPDG